MAYNIRNLSLFQMLRIFHINGEGELQTCKWTVQVGQATSLIRLPDPSDLDPAKANNQLALHIANETQVETTHPSKTLKGSIY